MRVKGLRQTKVSQWGASISCFQRLRGRRTARCSLGAGVWEEREAREEQDDDDDPASVSDGSEAEEAGDRGSDEEDARDSLEGNAAVREPRATCGEGIAGGDGIGGGGGGMMRARVESLTVKTRVRMEEYLFIFPAGEGWPISRVTRSIEIFATPSSTSTRPRKLIPRPAFSLASPQIWSFLSAHRSSHQDQRFFLPTSSSPFLLPISPLHPPSHLHIPICLYASSHSSMHHSLGS
jgi:hypothetical protein